MSQISTSTPIYLDYNATTPATPEVVEAMNPYWIEYPFNPSASYPRERVAHDAVELARVAMANLLGARSDTITFTSGGTESNNWVLRGAWRLLHDHRTRIIVSAVEHPAVMETAKDLQAMGAQIVIVPVDAEGVIRLEQLDEVLDEQTALVSVMLANNEVGTIQPIAEIARRAHAVGAWMHTDAAQAVGKIPIDVSHLGVDFMTIAGHKFYAPKGIGALYIREGVELPAFLTGGGQENGRRSGTEAVPLAVGLGVAAQLAQKWFNDAGPKRQALLRDSLQTQLLSAVPALQIFSRGVGRLPNTLALAYPNTVGSSVLEACLEIRAGTGSACHHSDDTGSPTLRAMGVRVSLARGLIRLSMGRDTTSAELDVAATVLKKAIEDHR
ncbi:MAG: cysteine desulfurase family protein [Ferrimicrobium sp.]